MVSPSAIEIVSLEFSNHSGSHDSNNGQNQQENYCADVLRITPSVVIGRVVGAGNLFSHETPDAMNENDDAQGGSLVIGIVPKSLENCKYRDFSYLIL